MTVNIDLATVQDFGKEWEAFDQTPMSAQEHARLFDHYFSIFPFDQLPADAEGFDLGCGSGRWAAGVAPRVGTLHCIDPAAEALAVAQRRLADVEDVFFHNAGVSEIPLPDLSQDFGYSLGVLHHIPDTEAAMAACTSKLKPGAPFLIYLYYSLDNRPWWFRGVWRVTDAARKTIAPLPFGLKKGLTSALAAVVYWPAARAALLLETLGLNVRSLPLSAYRRCSFYTMRTDSLDRFGTRLEHRFSRDEIEAMMKRCGLERVLFSENEPFWVAVGYKTR